MNKFLTFLMLLCLAGLKASAQPAAPTVTGTTTFCAGNGTTLTASGDPGATFKWYTAATGGTTLAGTAAYQVPVQNTAGTYHFFVEQTASFQTSTRTDVTVTVNPTPVVTVSSSQPSTICRGSSATLTATGAATYVWTNGPTTASYVVSPLINSTYTVVGKSALNCSSASVNTNVGVVRATAGGAATICLGGSATIFATGLTSLSWSPGNLLGESVIVSPTTTTLYTVTGTYAPTGCTSTDTVRVKVAPPLGLAAMSNTSVEEGSVVNLTASSTGATSYTWTPNQGSSSTLIGTSVYVVPVATTTYTVTGTNSTCSESANVTITVNKQVAVSGNTTLCAGSTTALTATGTGPFTWFTAASGGSPVYTGATFTTPAINANTAYWVAGANGLRKKVSVNVPGTASASALPSTICFGDTSRLTGNYLGLFKWYTAPTGGTLLGTTISGSGLAVVPTATTTYYGEALAAKVTLTFLQKDSVQLWTVPPGVTSIDIDAYGAQGLVGNQSNSRTSYHGLGGRVQATMSVTPGQVLYLYVGGNTWNGGGYGPQRGFGGDATDIRIGGMTLTDRVLVAGGGGGTGATAYAALGNSNRGHGGGLTGQEGGTERMGSYATSGGRGGTQSSGGVSANYNSYVYSQPGTFGQGSVGASDTGPFTAGGGGGGGWYGGSGGALYGDGGGGSSYTNPILFSNVIHTQGVWASVGELSISYGANCTGPAGRIPVTVSVTPAYAPVATDTQASYCAGSAVTLYASGLAPSKEVAVFNGTQGGSNGMANITSVANNFTMDFWVKPGATITAITPSTSGAPGTGGQNYAIAPFQSGTNGGAGVSVGTNGINVCEHGNSYLPALLSYTGTIPSADFTHVAVVYTNKQPSLYLNGALVATGLTSTMPNVYPSIGSGGAGGYSLFTGSLDNVRIWNGALAAADILAIKNKAEATVAGKTLVARYSFNGGTTADDKGSPTQPAWNAPASAQQQNYYTYTWSGTGALPAASNMENQTTTAALGATRYTVKASGGGCISAVSDTTIAITDPIPTATVAGTASVCKDAAMPSVAFTGTGSIYPYTFTYNVNGGTAQTAIATLSNIRYVRIVQNKSDWLNISEVQVFETGTGTNLALNKTVTASSSANGYPASMVNDGIAGTGNYWHSGAMNNAQYVEIDLGGTGYNLSSLKITNRADCCQDRLSNLQVIYKDNLGNVLQSSQADAYQGQSGGYTATLPVSLTATIPVTAPTAAAGSYAYNLVNVRSANGCNSAVSGTATVTVNPKAAFTAQPAASLAVCAPNPVTLAATATNAASYQWRKAGANISGATSAAYVKTAATAGDAGTYNVIAVNANGCNDTSTSSTVTINTMSTTLASGGAAASLSQPDGIAFNYTDVSCRPIAEITDASGGNTLGMVNANVVIDGTVKTFRGQPYLQRHYDIVPGSNGPATIKLYATQAEFDAYNTWISANGNTLPKMPTSDADNAGKANISITQFHGLASAGTSGPGGQYNVSQRELIPSSSITKTWTGNYWILSFPVSGFSGFFISTGSNAPLAIALLDLSAKNNGATNELTWSTATEDAGDYFEIERSFDAKSFTRIATVAGMHTTGGKYSLIDEQPATGTNYYRLKLMDAGGNTSYSKTVSAVVKQGHLVLEAYPNPVSDMLTLRVNGAIGANASVRITDLSGKVIKVTALSTSVQEIAFGELAAGMYLLPYRDDHQTQSIRINKK